MECPGHYIRHFKKYFQTIALAVVGRQNVHDTQIQIVPLEDIQSLLHIKFTASKIMVSQQSADIIFIVHQFTTFELS